MIWAAYIVLVAALAAALVDLGGAILRAISLEAQQAVRMVTFVFGLLIAVAASALALDSASEGHAFSADPLPYILFSSLGLGGVVYAVGTALWRGKAAHLLRAIGWALITVPLMFPTTLTLALVLIAPLLVTVTRMPGERNLGGTRTRPVTAQE